MQTPFCARKKHPAVEWGQPISRSLILQTTQLPEPARPSRLWHQDGHFDVDSLLSVNTDGDTSDTYNIRQNAAATAEHTPLLTSAALRWEEMEPISSSRSSGLNGAMEFGLFPPPGRSSSNGRLEASYNLVPVSPPPERASAQAWPNLKHRSLLRADCMPPQNIQPEAQSSLARKASQGSAVARPKWSQVANRKKTAPALTSKSVAHVKSPDTFNEMGLVPQPGIQPRSAKSANSVKLLAESLSYLTLSAASKQRTGRSEPYPVIRISNIPWSITLTELRSLVSHVNMPSPDEHAQNVHVIINKSTGKTMADAYIEVLSEQDVQKAVNSYKHPPIKGRKVFIVPSSQDQMLADLFPEWPGQFVHGVPVLDNKEPPTSIVDDDEATAPPPPPLIQRQEFESLLQICRNFKVHFSRKCGERPFENFISLLVKFPWDQPQIITTLQRDHLYEYYKLATMILKNHLSKPYVNLDRTLMTRMVRAAVQCPGLTIPQKKGVLLAGGATCPPNLEYLLVPPPTEDAEDQQESLI
ncbi:hypothetical protein BCR43DRAFT_481644 [Syncephalastrum racemosum]|uniref:RRM domain-containing protein n=1 Tax=Syncephalastrum racemosum TaxID=13706 RepID=A0A1X2HSI4_SYNRA|nr:hypothetical protein BCR43DRAFT_481644 [Syncephalastrum racemosum]